MLTMVLGLIGLVGCTNAPADTQTKYNDSDPVSIETRFSPNGGCAEMIIREILGSKNRVWVQAYSFTNVAIGEALVHQKQKGVDVVVILDRSNASEKAHTLIPLMMENDIKVFIDGAEPIAHNKVLIFDDKKVYFGSANFSRAGMDKNGENCNIITSHKTNIAYEDNWLKHREHSRLY